MKGSGTSGPAFHPRRPAVLSPGPCGLSIAPSPWPSPTPLPHIWLCPLAGSSSLLFCLFGFNSFFLGCQAVWLLCHHTWGWWESPLPSPRSGHIPLLPSSTHTGNFLLPSVVRDPPGGLEPLQPARDDLASMTCGFSQASAFSFPWAPGPGGRALWPPA